MATRTWLQAEYWKNPEVLLRHAIDMAAGTYPAWAYLGQALTSNPARAPESVSCFRKALGMRPADAESHNNLAAALSQGQFDEAILEYREAIRINPDFGPIHSGLGAALLQAGRSNEAIEEYKTALRLNPQLTAAHNNLGVLLCRTHGRFAEGLEHLERAVSIDPDDAQAQSNLGQALLNTPDGVTESIPHFRQALRIDLDLTSAHLGLGTALIRMPGREKRSDRSP